MTVIMRAVRTARLALSQLGPKLGHRPRAGSFIIPALVAAALLSTATVVGATGPHVIGHPRPLPHLTCAGPTAAQAALLAKASALGAKFQEAIYEQSRIGCVPLGANGKPKAGLLQAALRRQHLISYDSLSRAARTNSLTSIGQSWTPIGPAPIGTGALADSGRILSMAYDAALNGGTLFAGTAGGGVWSTTSPFTSWVTHTDGLPNLAISSVAFDPSNTNTIYAGTGEQSFAYDTLYGQGVYKSTDGGTTWAPVTGTPTGGWGLGRVSRIVVSTTGTVYVAVGSGSGGGAISISTDGGNTWNDGTGIPGGPGAITDSVSDLAIDSSNNIYAAVGRAYVAQADNGIWECASPCTAASAWTLLGGGSGGTNSFPASGAVASIKLTAIPTTFGGGGTALYAIASNSSQIGRILGVYRLLPGPTPIWSQIATSGNAASYENQAWYDMYMWGDPADASGATVYFGLTDLYKTTTGTTTPSWTNLTNVYGGDGTGVHPDQQAITSNGSSTIFFGNDGGAWDSTNGGTSFNDINGNLATLQFYDGALGTNAAEGCTANCDPTARIGGMQDNGTAQTTGGATVWTANPGFGDGSYALIDPHDNNNRYGENADGRVVHSTDGFGTASDMIPYGCGSSNFYGPMALDPATPTTLLIGMGDLCETTNATAVFPIWTNISASAASSLPVGAVAVSDAGGTAIYFSDDAGQTFFTTNNGATWTSMDTGAAGGPLAAIAAAHVVGIEAGPTPSWGFNLQISALAADPVNSGVVYAVLNGFQAGSAGHVFKWTDTGGVNGTWADISGVLPNEPYDSVAVNPANPNQIFVGGITGVFVTTNDGGTWNQMGTGLPNVQVDSLKVGADGSKLVAFTHGRSAWEVGLLAPVATQLVVSGYPSPTTAGVTHSLTVTATDSSNNTATGYLDTVHFSSDDPAAVLPADYTFSPSDAGTHVFNVTLNTAGTRSISATDIASASITGAQTGIVVSSSSPVATQLLVSGYPSPTTAGATHSLTVTATDGSSNTATGYLGTVHFTSSDPAAVLPADYTFSPSDAGTHVFNVTLNTAGTRSISATDIASATITGAQTGIVVTPVGVPRPDARIRHAGGRLRGNNIYNSDGTNQTTRTSAASGHSRWMYISVQNDGNAPDSFTVGATGTPVSGFTIRYYAGAEITGAVTAGTFTTPVLAPGATFRISVRIDIGSAAVVGSTVSNLVTVNSVASPSTLDAVGFLARRR